MRDSIIRSGSKARMRLIPDNICVLFGRMARRAVFAKLKSIEKGQLLLTDEEGVFTFGEAGEDAEPRAEVMVHDTRFYTELVFGGSIGGGEAYMAGYWTTEHLTELIRIIILNRHVMTGLEGGAAWLSVPLHGMLHLLRKNTRTGSRKNITAHYDLGNDFYSLFLDETMTYSCGIFTREARSLKDASIEKYDRICRKLLLTPNDHVLEIGGGWGGFALHAARHYGCRVTTTTISAEQYEFTQQMVRREGMEGRIEVIREDYRDLRGTYDKLVSIEMIEAVGHHYLGTFFRCCSRRVKEDGMMLLQAIIIDDREYERHKHSVDFIKRYIFPGSCIPSITAITDAVTRATDMRLFHLEDITLHYVRTIREWRKRFFTNINEVISRGYPDEFIRMWEYYLCYCEAGFTERYIGDVQMLFTKPGSERPPLLPPLGQGDGR